MTNSEIKKAAGELVERLGGHQAVAENLVALNFGETMPGDITFGHHPPIPDCISPPKSELAKRIHDLEADVERLSLEVEDLRLLLANVQVTLLKLKK